MGEILSFVHNHKDIAARSVAVPRAAPILYESYVARLRRPCLQRLLQPLIS